MTTAVTASRRDAMLAHTGFDLLGFLEAETTRWHNGAVDTDLSLREYLGLTVDEYQIFVVRPSDLLKMLSA